MICLRHDCPGLKCEGRGDLCGVSMEKDDYATYSDEALRQAALSFKRALNFSYGALTTPPPGADPARATEIYAQLGAIRAEQKRRQQ